MRSLPILAAQEIDGAPFEVLVVDSAADKAESVAELAAEQGARFLPFHCGPGGFNYARAYNAGIAAATGSLIVRLSGDAVPADTHWLRALTAPFASDDTLAATWGRQAIPAGVNNPIERWYEGRTRPATRAAPARFRTVTTPLGSSMALRRDLWERYPFDTRLPQAEDYDFLHHWTRRGMAGLYVPDAVIIHGHDEGWARAFRRSLAQSVLQGIIRLRR